MNKELDVSTKLIINGFTINPIIDTTAFEDFIKGMLLYKEKHLCDFNHTLLHSNYLSNMIGSPTINYLNNDSNSGLIGYALLENGYFVLKIEYNWHPARVQFDLYLDTKLPDATLIIDHLSAPASPLDGLGLFDISYSMSYITKPRSMIANKDNRLFYYTNEPFSMQSYESDKENYEVTLNELNNAQCYLCAEQATSYRFYDDGPRISILTCNKHAVEVTSREHGADKASKKDIRHILKSKKRYKMEFIEDGGYTRNTDNEGYQNYYEGN